MSRRKYIYLVILVGTSITLSCFLSLYSNAEDSVVTENKSILFHNSVVDLKDVPVGLSHKILFKYKNVSEEPIKIMTVNKSCQCVGNLSYSNAMMPSKTTSAISLEYEPSEGEKTYKLLAIFSNGEQHELIITSSGYYDIKLAVNELDFKKVASKVGATKSVKLYGSRKKVDLDQTRIIIDTPDWLCAQISTSKTTGEDFIPESKNIERFIEHIADIEVAITSDAPFGYFDETIVFEIGQLDDKRTLTLDCNGEVKREVSVSPSKLLFWGDSSDWQVILIKSINHPFSITSINSGSLEYFIQDDKSVGYTKKIKLKPLKNSNVDSLLTINIDHPSCKRLEVPVRRRR